MPVDLAARDLTDNAVLGGRLRLLQPRAGHRFGHDAILLAAATAAEPGQRAVDLGAGVGPAGLALAVRIPGISVTLVDVDASLVALAAENARRNGLADRVSAFALDVAACEGFAAAGLAPGSADHVLMNPPFNDPARSQLSPDPNRRRAHATPREMLGVWIATAGRLLRRGGTLTLIFSANGLGDVLGMLGEGFGATAVLPIYPKPAASAIRVIVRSVKASRAPLRLSPGLLLAGRDGQPTAEAEVVLREPAGLSFSGLGGAIAEDAR
jgi:tRNA1(Val) A37 N6-methylase TrmN6